MKKNGKRKNEGTGGSIAAALFSYTFLFLISYADILLYCGVVPQEEEPWIYFLGTAFLVLFFFLLYAFGRLGKAAHLMAGGMLFLWFLLCRENICGGLSVQLNQILDKVGAYFGVYLPHVGAEDYGNGYLAVIFAQALLIWLSSVGFFRIRHVVFTILPGILLCTLYLSVGMSPDLTGVFLLAVGAAGCLPFFHGRGIKRSGGMAALEAKAGAITSVVMFCFLFLSMTAGERYVLRMTDLHDKAMAYQRYAEEWIKDTFRFGPLQSSSGSVSNRSPKYEEETILTVRLNREPSGTYYLRGYVGDTYQGGSWGNNKASLFEAEIKGSMPLFEEESGKKVLNFLYHNEELSLLNPVERMTIEYINTEDSYAYLPYGADLYTAEGENGGAGFTVYGDAMIVRNNTDVISVEGSLTGTHFGNSAFPDSLDSLEERYTEFAEEYLEVPEGLRQINSLGDWLSGQLSQYYGEMYYVQDGELFLGRTEIAVCLAEREIAKRVSYSTDLDPVPIGEDVVQYFLFGSKKGFCQHYASAGTLLLRKLGVPARYVTGYAVSDSDFTLQPDGSYLAKVKDSDAHAWVEYYKEGAGWLPADLTEGSNRYAENMRLSALEQIDMGMLAETEEIRPTEEKREESSERQESSGQQNQTPPNQAENNAPLKPDDRLELKDEQNSQTKDGEAAEPDRREGFVFIKDQVRLAGTVYCFIHIVLGVILTAAAVLHVRREKKRLRLFRQKDCRGAVLSINRYMYRLLRRKRYLKKKPSDDREYKNLAKQGAPMEEWDHYFELVWLAYYSGEELSREDAQFCENIYKKIILLK